MTDGARDKRYLEVAAVIKEEVRLGTYGIGERLPSERDLARRLQVSRPTVREAMIHLEAQAIVEIRQGSGAYLLGPAADPIEARVAPLDLNEARGLLEAEVGALLARIVTDHQISTLAAIVETMAGPSPPDRWAFHAALAAMTANPAIVSALAALRRLDPGDACADADPHAYRTIVQTLRRRDGEAARRAIRALFHAVSQAILDREEQASLNRILSQSQARRLSVERRNAL